MQFKFDDGHWHWSGLMAFMGPTSRLLVTDAGHDAVHVIDVAEGLHVGYVVAPGAIAGPRGVAARGFLVAVSAWKESYSVDSVVRVFEGSGVMWTGVRVLAGGFGGPGWAYGQLYRPYGLRFTGDGTGLAVTDSSNGRVSVFRVEDGSFVRHVATGLIAPYDVEECEGGWLVACGPSGTIQFVDGAGVGRARLGSKDCGDGVFGCPSALALVPSLGLVVRRTAIGSRVQVFATPDAIAMASMSPPRVAWMVAVARGRVFREQRRQHARDAPTCKRRSRRGPAGPGASLKQQ
jgi:DNA-binding beta-propeller fold protein YncE